jgi:conjugal transfer pilus assembly protein TraA
MSKKKLKSILTFVFLIGAVEMVCATTGTEFKKSADKFEGWLNGEYGRMIALGGTGVGAFIGMVSKSFMPVLWGVGAAISIPLISGMIKGSFTAVL